MTTKTMTTRAMINPTDRITRMLLHRLDRKANHDVYNRAEALGLLNRSQVKVGGSEPLLIWGLPDTLPVVLTGRSSVDRRIVERFLARRPIPTPDPFADLGIDEDDGEGRTTGHTFDGRPLTTLQLFAPKDQQEGKPTAKTGAAGDGKTPDMSPAASEAESVVPEGSKPATEHRETSAAPVSRSLNAALVETALGSRTASPKTIDPAAARTVASNAPDETYMLGREYLLRLIRSCRARPSVPDAAVALLLARVVGESMPDLTALLDILRRPAPVIVIRAPVPEFEERFGRMMEKGLVMPFGVNMLDAFGDRALGGRYRDNASDPHRITTMSGKTLGNMSAQYIREALAKTSMQKELPLLVADETGTTDFPKRLLAGADLVLETGGINRALLAELLQVCLGFAPKAALAAMEALGFRPGMLGLDDLALALRPGRSLENILAVLAALSIADETDDDDQDDENADSRPRHKIRNKPREKRGSLIRDKKSSAFELTQPQRPPSTQGTTEKNGVPDGGNGKADGDDKEGASPGSSDTAGKPSSSHRYLSVETLSGYGLARNWAMDLKADLELWRQGGLTWSDMSTKLLLSGPPGTGKTTFARALCNSLQIPMLATSLSSMLEPGYLGDVLKAMSAAFETAREHAPSILFMDEIDNIGKRSAGGDKNGDYWNSLINRMLELLDGVGRTEGVIVVAATNHPDRIDGALLRSGRLETRIDIPPPDTEALAGILAHHLGSDLATVLATQSVEVAASVARSDDRRATVVEQHGPGNSGLMEMAETRETTKSRGRNPANGAEKDACSGEGRGLIASDSISAASASHEPTEPKGDLA